MDAGKFPSCTKYSYQGLYKKIIESAKKNGFVVDKPFGRRVDKNYDNAYFAITGKKPSDDEPNGKKISARKPAVKKIPVEMAIRKVGQPRIKVPLDDSDDEDEEQKQNDSDNESDGEHGDKSDESDDRHPARKIADAPKPAEKCSDLEFWQAIGKINWGDKTAMNEQTLVRNAVRELNGQNISIRAKFNEILNITVDRYRQLRLQDAAKLTDDELEKLSSHTIAMGEAFYEIQAFELDLIMWYATERIYIDFRPVIAQLRK